jgi:hypothetical protein
MKIIEQKLLDRRHRSSSVGARPSPAAPVDQKSISQSRCFQLKCCELGHSMVRVRSLRMRVLIDGGGRGRPRSDRRASVSPVKELLFDDLHPGLTPNREWRLRLLRQSRLEPNFKLRTIPLSFGEIAQRLFFPLQKPPKNKRHNRCS